MRKRLISRIYLFLSLLIGFGILSMLVCHVGVGKFSAIIMGGSPLILIAVLIIYSTSWFFRTSRLRQLTLQNGYKIKSINLFKLSVSSFALNTILPARLGDASMVGYLKMQGITLGESAAIVIQTRILDLLAIVVLIAMTISFMPDSAMHSWVWKAIYLIMFMTVIICTIGFVDRQKKVSEKILEYTNKIKYYYIRFFFEKLIDTYDRYYNIASDRGLFFRTFLSSCIIWIIEGAACYFVAKAVEIQVTFLAAIFAVALANMGKAIPATFGGIGIYEGILAAIFVSLGNSIDVAIVAAILDHFTKKAFTLGFGIPATFTIIGRQWGKKFDLLLTEQ